jgi:PAS domain S-box-containing protein
MELLNSLLGRNGFLPHGYCFTWSPGLLWTMVSADALIALSYFSIPLALMSFIRRRRDVAFPAVAALFSAFIFACGLTHVLDIWTIWQPDYALHAATKALTAVVSVTTAVALWPLMPRALRIPSVAQLRSVIQSLEAEVAKRRSAEEHLAELQQNLAVTLASIGAGFMATDREGRVTRMNSVAEQVLGWTQAQALGQPLLQVFQREHRPPEYEGRNPVELVQERGITIERALHFTAIARDGTRTPLEVKAALTRAEDGSVRGVAMVFRDLGPQLRAAEQGNRLAAIVESSNDAIVSTTLSGRITTWNRGAEALFGHSAAEAIGQPVQMLMPPAQQQEEARLLTELARGASVPTFDTVRRARDGRLLQVSISISPIRDAMGRIVGASKIARDVSAQRRAEAALRESEARLRFTLESAQIGDWDLDLATGLIHRSLRHDRCFGYETLQPEWTPALFLAHVLPEDRAQIQTEFDVANSQRGDWAAECRVRWPDGSVHWIRAHGRVRCDDGVPTRMLGIVADITASRQAEEARLTAQRLEAENRQIQEANRLKTQFLANMSHELRTPLNAIIGFADLLHRGAVKPESPKHHEFLGHIGSSGRHLLQLINDVLDLSKVESGRFEFFPEPVQLPALVREVRDVLATGLQRKRLHFSSEIDERLTGLVLDPARLKQALYNYLSNAIKFTPDEGHIVVRALPEGPRHLRLEVQDSGIGITAADLPRLFTEFQQLDSGYTKQHAGTGLGLALTRRLVQAQGGSVGVRSTPGVGSVFHLVLPRTPDDAQRLLVVEADPGLQARVVQGGADAGFAVDTAASAEQALRQARLRPYSAIALDLNLPDQPGLGLLQRIRDGEGASRAAPVVAVSVPATTGASATFVVADVLSKPLRTEEVVLAMQRLQRGRGPGEKAPLRVLVVDDDPLACDLMRATLAGLGLQVTALQDGRQALRELSQHRPDALVLDLVMPEFDGFAVLDALRRLPEGQQLPVFIWTSMELNDEEMAGLSRTAQGIIGKGGGTVAPLAQGLRRWGATSQVLE